MGEARELSRYSDGRWVTPVVFNLEYEYPRGLHEDMLTDTPKYLTSIKMKHRNLLNLELALILALTKILP
jgi:hypothetical protein